jgi:spermidine synthase
MKKILTFSLGVLGFSSLVSQVIIARELAMSFYANEFFIGWVLFCWLLGTSAGSVLGSRSSGDAQGTYRLLAICHFLIALFFPFAIILIRSGKWILGTPAGAIPELFPSLAYSFAVLVPLCGVLGMQFAVAAKGWRIQMPGEDSARAVGGAYLRECLGFVAGGAVFSFFLIFANEFRVAAVLAFLNLAAAGLVFDVAFGNKMKLRWAPFAVAGLLTAGLFFSSAFLQQRTSQFRFPNETLLQTRNTVHGNVSVTRLGRQCNFYQNGLLLGTDRADLESEYLVHFPMLAHPSPKRVLLLGTGFNGPIEQVLRHGPSEVVSAELDPELLKIAAGFLPDDLKKTLDDPRVKIRSRDPLDFLRSEERIFDVIIANFPDPVSVLINRNYTEQFFRLVRARLAPDGVFATHITFAANFVTPELERLGSSVYETLGQVFPVIRVLPEDTLFFLAAGEAASSWDASKMAQRLSGRKVPTDFVTADLIRYRLENDRVERVRTAFRNVARKIINTDLHPRAFYFAFLRWLGRFNPDISKPFLFLARIPFFVVLGASLLMILFSDVFAKGPEKRLRSLSLVSMGTAGFSLMAFEILGIYLFQATFGDLYYRLAWVITAFMAGLGAGTWAVLRLWKIPERSALVMLHTVNAAFFFVLIKVCVRIFSNGFFPGDEYQLIFFGMAFWGGLVAGMVFPLANRLYLAKAGGERLGIIYAADLGGSALGALLTAGFLIPIWGVLQTLALLGAINVLLALLLFFGQNLRRKDL